MRFPIIGIPADPIHPKLGYDMRDLMASVELPIDLDDIWKNDMTHFAFKGKMSKLVRCSVCGKYIDPATAVHKEVSNPWYVRYLPCGIYRSDEDAKKHEEERGKEFRDAVVCDGCGSTCIVYSLRRNTNFDRFYANAKVELINVVGDRVLLQKFFITRIINCETMLEDAAAEEYLRYTLIGDNVIHISKDHLWLGKYLWGLHGTEMTAEIERSSDHSIIVASSKLSRIPALKYTMIGDYLLQSMMHRLDGFVKGPYAQEDRSMKASEAFDRICVAAKRPWIEFLWKMGLKQFYHEIVDGRANMTIVTPGQVRKNAKLLKQANADFSVFYAIRQYQKRKMDLPDAETLSLFSQTDGYSLGILFESLNGKMDFKYVGSQLKRGMRVIGFNTYWKDYHSMLKTLNGDAEIPEYLLYPKDLKEAHDEAARRINDIKMEKENAKFKKIAKELAKYEYLNAGFGLAIIAPKKATDLTFEGATLGHCVGGYVDRVIKHETTILFLRKLECPDEPLGTIEYRDGKIVQCRGYHNENDKLPPNYKDFLADWQKHIKEQTQEATS